MSVFEEREKLENLKKNLEISSWQQYGYIEA